MSETAFAAGQPVTAAELARSGLLRVAEGSTVSGHAVFVPADAQGESRPVEIGAGCQVGPFTVIYGGAVLGDGTRVEEHVIIGKPEQGYAVGHSYPGAGAVTVIGPGAVIRAGAIVYAGAEVGAATVVGHHTLLRSFVIVGEDTQLGHNLTIERGSRIGARVRCSPGSHITSSCVLADRVFLGAGVRTVNDRYLIWQDPDQQQERGIITTAAYREIGGVEGALARSAERALWQRADTSERPAVERVLIQMVRPGEQLDAGGRAPDTRRVASRDEFDDHEWGLIHRLASTRLVSITRQPTGPHTAELAHEALLTAWPRLTALVDANWEFRTWHEGLRRVIRQWRDHGQDARFLLAEPYLGGALEWMRIREPDLTLAERDFIHLSVAVARRRRRRRSYRFGAAALAVLVALGAGAFAIQQRINGNIQRENSLSQQIAAEAAGLDISQPNLAKQLRLAAYQVAPTPQAYSSLFSAADRPGTISAAGVTNAAFSPDGRLLAIVAGQEVRLWNRATHNVVGIARATGGATHDRSGRPDAGRYRRRGTLRRNLADDALEAG
jgi:acetyltransferase-like isoleucine patch superfamily enzyme